MARPRIIKLNGGGEIVFREVSKELFEAVENLIYPKATEPKIDDQASAQREASTPAPSAIVSLDPPKIKIFDMPMRAVGNYKNDLGLWEAYAVKFNLQGQSKLEEIKVLSSFKDEAVFTFKMLADKYEFV